MFGRITPQEAGLPEGAIERFLAALRRSEINMHSLIMMKGNCIFYQREWAPYTVSTPHRMYSVTKSFVSMAIGCLADEGKLQLDDPIIRYFPDKLPEHVAPFLARQTVRHMLMMSTCFTGGYWFVPEVTDRTKFYFSLPVTKPAGALFNYDSTGSYILGVLAERVSGMKLLDYLRYKILDRLGGFDDAEILATPDGTPWGDSALICSTEALLRAARFVMNYGTWNGERLLSESYLRAATSVQTTNDLGGYTACDTRGYGYQFWKTEYDGFAFWGMGGQFAICIPEKDFIFVCTGDNQYNPSSEEATFQALFRNIVDELPGGPAEVATSQPADAIGIAHGASHSAFADTIHGADYICEDNPMGITRFRFEFEDGQGVFIYRNAQGDKRIVFGMGRNAFGKFPQLGYSNDRGNVHEITDFMYDCAASAGWIEEQKLQIRIQIVDRYFGSTVMTFGFVDENTVGIRMTKVAEDFLDEYNGWMIAVRERD